MTQYNVHVIGSLRNGYTANAEKVVPDSVSNLVQPEVQPEVQVPQPEVQVPQPEVQVPQPEVQPQSSIPSPRVIHIPPQQQALSLRLQKGRITASVNIAADAARASVKEIMEMLRKVGRGIEINNSILNTCEKTEIAAKKAVTEAEAAVNIARNAEEEVKAGMINKEAELTMANALTTSKEAETEVKKAIEEIKMVQKGHVANQSKRNAVIAAKDATETAMSIWDGIYNKMIQKLSGGYKRSDDKRSDDKRSDDKRSSYKRSSYKCRRNNRRTHRK